MFGKKLGKNGFLVYPCQAVALAKYQFFVILVAKCVSQVTHMCFTGLCFVPCPQNVLILMFVIQNA